MATDLVFSIEGLGVDSTARIHYFARGSAPSWDSGAGWIEGAWSGFPGEVSSAVSYLDGSSTIGGLSLQVHAQALTQQGATVASLLYNQTRVSVATLETSQTSTTDTTFNLDATTLANTVVVIGREAIKLGSHAGSGIYNSCTRGVFGTRATKHLTTDSTQVYLASAGPILRWRKVTLYRVDLDSATGYSDLEQLWSGVLFDVSAPSPNLIRIDADSTLSIIERMTICNNLFRGGRTTRVRHQIIGRPPIPDGAELYSFEGRREDVVSPSTAVFSVDGQCVVTPDFTTQNTQTYDTTGTPVGEETERFSIGVDQESIVRALDSGDAQQALPDNPKTITQCFRASALASASTGSLPLSRNLITCFLQILMTSDDGSNGDYDVTPASPTGEDDLGLGIPQADVDIDTFERIRGQFGATLEQDLIVFALDGEPVKVLDYFRERLLPYGIVIVDRGGKISCAVLSDSDPDAPTLTEASGDILGPASKPPRDPPRQSRRMDMATDSYAASYRGVPGVEPVVDTFTDGARRRINIYGDGSPRPLNLRGLKERGRAAAVTLGLLQRFHDDIPQVALTVLRTRTDLDLGDLVLVTHSKIYTPTGGTRSVSGQQMLIIERTLDLSSNTLDLVMLDVGAIYGSVGQIAPALVVDGYSAPTLTVELNKSAGGFQSGQTAITVDTGRFAVGDVVAHCSSVGVQLQLLTIASIPTNATLTFTTTPSPAPSAGDVIRHAPYTSGGTAAKARFAYLADSAGTLGSDAGKEYTFQ
jgi:hypothetical protein